jgi:hypothetical protein
MMVKINSSKTKIGYVNNICFYKIKDTGCYIIIVNSAKPDGPHSIFCIAKSDKSQYGNITILTHSINKLKDYITLEWNPFEYPVLFYNSNYTKKDYKGFDLEFHVKVM